MTDDTETTETEDAEQQTDDVEEISFNEMMDFAIGRVETETEQFDGDVPQHAASLLVSDIGALHGTLMNIQMARSNEEMPDPEEGQISDALSEDAVDILFALGALTHEFDLDIEKAFRERVETIEMHEKLEAAMEGAEGQGEMMEAMEEHLGEEQMEEMMGGMGMTPPPEPGDDVTDDDYDPENPDRHVQ